MSSPTAERMQGDRSDAYPSTFTATSHKQLFSLIHSTQTRVTFLHTNTVAPHISLHSSHALANSRVVRLELIFSASPTCDAPSAPMPLTVASCQHTATQQINNTAVAPLVSIHPFFLHTTRRNPHKRPTLHPMLNRNQYTHDTQQWVLPHTHSIAHNTPTTTSL